MSLFLIFTLKGAAFSMMSTEAVHDVQQALDILEYTLSATSYDHTLPISVRHQLIKAHVLCKGISNQQYAKNFLTENDNLVPQGAMIKALYSLEIYSLQCEKVLEMSSNLNANDVSVTALFSTTLLCIRF